MRADILRAGRPGGLPIIGECGGYMYLCECIQSWPMVGLVPGKCRMTEKLGPFGYMRGTCRKDSLIGKAGETFMAHEFHYSLMADGGEDFLLAEAGRRSPERRNGRKKYICGLSPFILLCQPGNSQKICDGDGGKTK